MGKLDRMKDAEVAGIARKMFYGGFFLLPFLWLINAVYLYPTLRARPAIPRLRLYVVGSALGSAVWFAALTSWYVVFVTHRVAWGAAGDALTVVIPKGV